MEIKTTNVRVQASKNYQVFEVSFEATDCSSPQDLESLKNAAIKYALRGINELCQDDEKKPEVTVSTSVPKQVQTNVPNVPKLGDVRVFNGFQYKYSYSKQTQQNFWVLVNPDDMNRGASKYYKASK